MSYCNRSPDGSGGETPRASFGGFVQNFLDICTCRVFEKVPTGTVVHYILKG